MDLPSTFMHDDWQSWANALTLSLGEEAQLTPIPLASFATVNLPTPNRDGLIAFALNEVTGAQPVYSEGGAWRLFGSGVVTGPQEFDDEFGEEFA